MELLYKPFVSSFFLQREPMGLRNFRVSLHYVVSCSLMLALFYMHITSNFSILLYNLPLRLFEGSFPHQKSHSNSHIFGRSSKAPQNMERQLQLLMLLGLGPFCGNLHGGIMPSFCGMQEGATCFWHKKLKRRGQACLKQSVLHSSLYLCMGKLYLIEGGFVSNSSNNCKLQLTLVMAISLLNAYPRFLKLTRDTQ